MWEEQRGSLTKTARHLQWVSLTKFLLITGCYQDSFHWLDRFGRCIARQIRPAVRPSPLQGCALATSQNTSCAKTSCLQQKSALENSHSRKTMPSLLLWLQKRRLQVVILRLICHQAQCPAIPLSKIAHRFQQSRRWIQKANKSPNTSSDFLLCFSWYYTAFANASNGANKSHLSIFCVPN